MPAPTRITYDAAALIAVNTELLTFFDAGSKLRLYDDNDTILVAIGIADPAGTVDGTTGVLTFDLSQNVQALAGGVCTYAAFEDSSDTQVIILPVAEGTQAEAGKLVLNSTNIDAGAPISILSAIIQ
jgi:hypothetical protein